jgi:dipeptidyl aminopeptidase/acylaminoacyl peptidase
MLGRLALSGTLVMVCALTAATAGISTTSHRTAAAAITYDSRIVDTYKIGKRTYTRYRNNEVLSTTAAGATPLRLTKHPATDASPTWSPNGAQVAFESNRNGDWNSYNDSDIYVMNANGTKVREVTFSNSFDGDPAWGHSGKIAFESMRTGNGDVWTVSPGGSGETNLTGSSKAFDGDPSWSPDGTKIAFTSERDNGDREIYVMNADGSNPTRLTTSPGFDENPSWSPSGSQIAFDTNRDGNLEIYAMNADGSSVHRVTNHPAIDALPSYLPDGRIVFVSERIAKGQRRLFVTGPNGGAVTQVTKGAYDMSPDANRY